MNEITISVGARIESDGHYATVKYVGKVPPTSGIWVGVEWDDSSRGKHDGCYEGVRYFSTEHSDSGSFLRPKKCNFGVPFMLALEEKYGRIEDENELMKPEELYVLGTKQKTRVEWVGAQKINMKQSQFRELKEVDLSGLYVNGPGTSGDIASNTPNIRLLNLSVSLISAWSEVGRIGKQMPLLTELNVSSNRLQLPEDDPVIDEESAFPRVRIIYANRLNYEWKEVVRAVKMFKNLSELHVCYNRITSLRNPPSCLEHLTLLNLEGNLLQEWENVLCLSELKLLETLIMNRTGIREVSFPDGPRKTKYFLKLASLSLSHNKISEWHSINELNKLESLTILRFQNNPLVEAGGGASAVHTVIIAKLAKLRMLNSMAVTTSERRGAELDYLKMYGLDWKKAGGSITSPTAVLSDAFTTAHPRYVELVEKLGAAEDSEMTKNESSALKNNLITVKIKSLQVGDSHSLTSKKIPLTMTVQKLKAMVQRLFRIPDQSTMKLTYVSAKAVGPEIELDSNLREVGFYSVEDGDTICVQW